MFVKKGTNKKYLNCPLYYRCSTGSVSSLFSTTNADCLPHPHHHLLSAFSVASSSSCSVSILNVLPAIRWLSTTHEANVNKTATSFPHHFVIVKSHVFAKENYEKRKLRHFFLLITWRTQKVNVSLEAINAHLVFVLLSVLFMFPNFE